MNAYGGPKVQNFTDSQHKTVLCISIRINLKRERVKTVFINFTKTNSNTMDKDFGFSDDQEVAVKMRGVPYRASDEEVYDFFKDFKVKEDSLVW